MDKFMPKTIEELNAEFEARMEKAKQDELNAAAERAAEEILEAERMRAAHNAEEKAEARRVEERSYESALDSSISATELEPTRNDFEDSYSGEDEVPAEEPVKTEPAETEPEKVEAEPVQKTENEYGEPDPHGYFGAPIDKSRPRQTLSEETAAKVEPKFDFERTSDYSGAMLQDSFKPKKDKFKGARIFSVVLIIIIAVMSLLTALLSVAAAHPDKFLLDRGLAVCTDDIMGSNIKDGSLCLTRRASAASADEVALYKLGEKYGFAFGSALPTGASAVAVATHCVPFLGKFIASVINMWLVYACSALAAILVIMIIKIAAFGKPDDNVTDGVKRKKSRK
mgnify:FL=1